jgi:hypothetical protein
VGDKREVRLAPRERCDRSSRRSTPRAAANTRILVRLRQSAAATRLLVVSRAQYVDLHFCVRASLGDARLGTAAREPLRSRTLMCAQERVRQVLRFRVVLDHHGADDCGLPDELRDARAHLLGRAFD